MLVTLARASHQGWIKEVEGDSVERRRAYHLTAEGRRVLRTELRRLEVIVVEAQSGRFHGRARRPREREARAAGGLWAGGKSACTV